MRFGFDFKHFRGDFFGGLTAGIVALPLALAFGLQSGMGATAGLYGAIFISFFAALFGGTRTQISGPTAPMTAVSMVVIAGIIANFEGSLEKALPSILFVFILAGLLQIGLGILRVGTYIRYIPYPVVSGFMTGIGVIILITQILPLVGYYPKEDVDFVNQFRAQAEEVILEKILIEEVSEDIMVLEDFEQTIDRAKHITEDQIQEEAQSLAGQRSVGVIGSIRMMGKAMKNINQIDLILGLLTIFIIYGFKRITKAVPSTLVALIAVSLGAYFFVGDYRTIGEIPSGFPAFKGEIFTDINLGSVAPYVVSAISLAILGAIDSLLTSIVADNMTKTKHHSNQELIGQGIGNVMASLFGGIPGAGATIRTVVNIEAGGKTKLSGMIAGVVILIVLLLMGNLASQIPAAVLAGILITVGIGVMDWKGLRALTTMPRTEVVIMIIVVLLTVFIGLIEAVIVGLIMAALLFMKKISDVVENRTEIAPLQEFSRELPWDDEVIDYPEIKEGVYIKHLYGPLFFGFASRFQDMIMALPKVKVVIIRMERVPYVDQSGLYAMEDAILDLQNQGIKILFTGLHGQPKDMFESFSLVPGFVPESQSFEDFDDCEEWLEKYFGVRNGGVPQE